MLKHHHHGVVGDVYHGVVGDVYHGVVGDVCHGVVGDVCLPIHDVHCVLVPVDIMYRVDPDLHRISNSLDVDPVQKNADF